MPTTKTTYDFGQGLVPAHQHLNGGGWVADSADVDNTATVGKGAIVGDLAIIEEGATVEKGAIVEKGVSISAVPTPAIE